MDDLIESANKNNIGRIVASALALDFSQLPRCFLKSEEVDEISEDEEEHSEDDEDEFNVVDTKLHSETCDYSALTVPSESHLDIDSQSLSNSVCHCAIGGSFLPTPMNITPSTVEHIEEELDFHEKVSLVFLLYDSADLALQCLKVGHRSSITSSMKQFRPLSDWAVHESSPNWPDKLLEALCIIQNYYVVQKLGYSKEEMVIRFLPNSGETSLFVDLFRKALYRVCESLTATQLDQLLQLALQDMQQEGMLTAVYDTEFMEMNLLHWMSQRYLKVMGPMVYGTVDVKNLTKHLKVMNEFALVDYLESVVRQYNRGGGGDDEGSVFSKQMNIKKITYLKPSTSHKLPSRCEGESYDSSSDYYNMDPHNVGCCLIINQKNFYEEKDPKLQHYLPDHELETRIGTDVDRDRLHEIFIGFGFEVQICENLNHQQIMKEIRRTADILIKEEHSCFVLCILSHGKENAVYGTNSIPVNVNEITNILSGKYYPKLLGKPKIVIIQACQGTDKQDALPVDVQTDGAHATETCPVMCDMMIFLSSVPGYAAFRDRVRGSWFIESLWNEMLCIDSSCDRNIIDICTKVNREVCRKQTVMDGALKAMTPQFTTTFRKKLCLPYQEQSQITAAIKILERYMFTYLFSQYVKLRMKPTPFKNTLEM